MSEVIFDNKKNFCLFFIKIHQIFKQCTIKHALSKNIEKSTKNFNNIINTLDKFDKKMNVLHSAL